jgi:hypothetical protein
MATFISIAGDEKTEKTQSNPTSASRSRLVSSFPQPLSFLFVISSAFSLAANFTSPSCRCCKFFNHTLLSHSSLLFSSFPKWMSLFFFFTICYLESYMCSYTLFYNFQLLIFLLFSEFYLAFCSFSFSVLISLHTVVDSTGTSLTLLVHIAIYEVGIIF